MAKLSDDALSAELPEWLHLASGVNFTQRLVQLGELELRFSLQLSANHAT
jgi:hypothetical protein